MRKNDYYFGERLFNLRNRANISQTELASMLKVTNKAVSKWENGSAKPSLETLKRLGEIFNVSIDSLLEDLKVSNKKICKIVLTGGPCAGKSTAMSWIQSHFEKLDYKVIFIAETATEVINAGFSIGGTNDALDFQKAIVKMQLEKEKIFTNLANTCNCNKVLIVCDRGVLDCKAFISQLEFNSVLESLNQTEIQVRDDYDAVFHLVTSAKGAVEFYSLENNTARKETPEQAVLQDDKLISAWTGHPHLRIIDNSTNFQDKMKRLINEITNFLGEPAPYEIERKFLIKYPNIKWLENNLHCRKVEIIQTYLSSNNGDEIRIRQRGSDGNYTYFKTTKRKINELKRLEIENKITEKEYLSLLLQADTNKHQIRKTRYCLSYENQYFEIDIYPFWKDKAICEIELCDENVEIRFPKEIEVIKEVTFDENFKNSNLSKNNI